MRFQLVDGLVEAVVLKFPDVAQGIGHARNIAVRVASEIDRLPHCPDDLHKVVDLSYAKDCVRLSVLAGS